MDIVLGTKEYQLGLQFQGLCSPLLTLNLAQKLSKDLEERQIFPTGWLQEGFLEEAAFSKSLAGNLDREVGGHAR